VHCNDLRQLRRNKHVSRAGRRVVKPGRRSMLAVVTTHRLWCINTITRGRFAVLNRLPLAARVQLTVHWSKHPRLKTGTRISLTVTYSLRQLRTLMVSRAPLDLPLIRSLLCPIWLALPGRAGRPASMSCQVRQQHHLNSLDIGQT
jgi:hypothetical protein